MVNCFCGERAVFLADKPLCKKHFSEWLKGSIQKELTKFVVSSDKLAVAVSGGKDSTTLLDVVNEWSKKNKVPFFAISINEGIKGYRNVTLPFLKKFCKERDIDLKIVSFKKEVGKTLDELIEVRNKKKLEENACTICGTFRRYLLNKFARINKATKILFAHNLDDEVQTFLMNILVGNLPQMTTKGEIGGIISHPLFVVRFKPLIYLPEKAFATYALLNYPEMPQDECPYHNESIRSEAREFLKNIEITKKGAKTKLLKIYLDKILPSLKENSKKIHSNINICKMCGEPSSRSICNFCNLKNKLI